jgi:peptidoglycan/LPS O-acetylase OafA/YrhL
MHPVRPHLAVTANPQIPRRYEALDILRGFAALVVFVLHFFALYPSGRLPALESWNRIILSYFGMGVPLFYALSGLSLYIGFFPLRHAPEFARSFFLRRLLRITPLFYAATAVWVVIHLCQGGSVSITSVLLTLSYCFNLVPGQHESVVAAGWSIGVEMIFYALFPLIAVIVCRLAVAVPFYLLGCGLAALSWNLLHALFQDGSYPNLSFLGNLQYFATGILAYFLADALQSHPRHHRWIKYFTLVAAAFLSIGLTTDWAAQIPRLTDPAVGRNAWTIPILALCLTGMFWNGSGRLFRPFVKLGEWSFSLYLLHPIVLHFVFAYQRDHPGADPQSVPRFAGYLVTSAAILIATASITYKLIEKPFIKLARRLTAGASIQPLAAADRHGLVAGNAPGTGQLRPASALGRTGGVAVALLVAVAALVLWDLSKPPRTATPSAPTAQPEYRLLGLPVHTLKVPQPVVPWNESGRSLLLLHAPSQLELEIPPGTTAATITYGIGQGAYSGSGATDGAVFRISVIVADQRPQVLFARTLKPLANPVDAGLHTATVEFPTAPQTRLLLETQPNDNNNWDWTLWGELKLR